MVVLFNAEKCGTGPTVAIETADPAMSLTVLYAPMSLKLLQVSSPRFDDMSLTLRLFSNPIPIAAPTAKALEIALVVTSLAPANPPAPIKAVDSPPSGPTSEAPEMNPTVSRSAPVWGAVTVNELSSEASELLVVQEEPIEMLCSVWVERAILIAEISMLFLKALDL